MMSKRTITLRYGKGDVTFEIPEKQILCELNGRNRPPLQALRDAYLAALDHPVDSAPLREMVTPGGTVAVTVSDITRGWQKNAETLPFLLDYLNAAGVSDERITIIIAVGAHRQNTPEEFVELCGPEVCHRVRVVNHDAWDERGMVPLGRTSRGTPVEVSRVGMEADTLILTGGVIYHYMVGYGGGRKSVMPGICSNRTIQSCHLWSLEREPGGGRSHLSQSGITDGNPSHEDMMECASLAKPDFIVNVVPNLDGRLCGIFAGNWVSAWLKATRLVSGKGGHRHRHRRWLPQGHQPLPDHQDHGQRRACRQTGRDLGDPFGVPGHPRTDGVLQVVRPPDHRSARPRAAGELHHCRLVRPDHAGVLPREPHHHAHPAGKRRAGAQGRIDPRGHHR